MSLQLGYIKNNLPTTSFYIFFHTPNISIGLCILIKYSTFEMFNTSFLHFEITLFKLRSFYIFNLHYLKMRGKIQNVFNTNITKRFSSEVVELCQELIVFEKLYYAMATPLNIVTCRVKIIDKPNILKILCFYKLFFSYQQLNPYIEKFIIRYQLKFFRL